MDLSGLTAGALNEESRATSPLGAAPERASATPDKHGRLGERAFFLSLKGDQLYCVQHSTEHPRAVVVLAGPFASERPFVYAPWVRWARFLAANGFEVLRFDYRGVGESTGSFQEMDFQSWAEDIECIARWGRAQFSAGALILHGLGLGGLLAADRFEKGLGDALLLWSAPASGEDVLREGLLRRLSVDYLLQANGPRKSYEDYVADLRAGNLLTVVGYPWSRHLWVDGDKLRLPAAYLAATAEAVTDGRPWKHIKLDKSHVPLVSGLGQWQAINPRAQVKGFPLNPDLTTLFAVNLNWIRTALNLGPKPAA